MDHIDDTARRVAGLLFVAGAVLLLGGNLVHPVDADPTELSRLDLAGGIDWIAIHLVIAVGMLAVTIGLALFAGVVRERAEPAATVLAVVAVIGGTLMTTVFAVLDGYAMSTVAESWQGAGTDARASLEVTARTLDAIDTGLAGLGTLLLMGVAMVALGACLVHAEVGRRWLRILPFAVGAGGAATGVTMLVSGASDLAINVLLRPTAAGMTILVLALGITLRRSPARADATALRGPRVPAA